MKPTEMTDMIRDEAGTEKRQWTMPKLESMGSEADVHNDVNANTDGVTSDVS